MDGYAADGAAMTLRGMKITPYTHTPLAIFCDVDVMKNAPMPMLAAGLGDIIGKLSSLADWRLSHLLTGEPMPGEIKALIEDAVKKCSQSVGALARREPEAVADMAEGLILSGIAMSLYGDSRPASGTEHHLSHYWEMRFLAEGRPPVAHGLKVGVGTLCALRAWKSLPETPLPPKAENRAEIERLVAEKYGETAQGILKTQNPNVPFAEIERRWGEIREIADSLPAPEEVEALLDALGAPLTPREAGVCGDLLKESVLLARERKKMYTLLQLLGDLGLLERTGEALERYYARRALAKTRCFVLDLDGTVYLGNTLFDFSKGFLDAAKRAGRDVVFFTNNSSKSHAAYIGKLRGMGIEIPPEKLLMSTQVIIDFLKTKRPNRRVWAAGTPDMLNQFREAGIDPQSENPEIAVLGFDTTLDYEKLRVIHAARLKGAELLLVNRDLVCPVPGGSIPDCGAMGALFAAIGGDAPESFGKPTRRALDYITRRTGYAEEELCFVGDRLYTDIAITSGTRASSVLVLSGESKREDIARCPEACPDMVVRDLGELTRQLTIDN
jgi:glycerol-1-phosphate dehydrogenase [NAD(P)+]